MKYTFLILLSCALIGCATFVADTQAEITKLKKIAVADGFSELVNVIPEIIAGAKLSVVSAKVQSDVDAEVKKLRDQAILDGLTVALTPVTVNTMPSK